MMFHEADQHYIALGSNQTAAGQLIYCFRCILSKDTHIFIRVGPHKTQHSFTGLFVGLGGELALKTCPTMNAAVVNQKIVYSLPYGQHRWGRGSVIQVDISALAAIQQWHLHVQSFKQVPVR